MCSSAVIAAAGVVRADLRTRCGCVSDGVAERDGVDDALGVGSRWGCSGASVPRVYRTVGDRVRLKECICSDGMRGICSVFRSALGWLGWRLLDEPRWACRLAATATAAAGASGRSSGGGWAAEVVAGADVDEGGVPNMSPQVAAAVDTDSSDAGGTAGT